MRNDEPGRPSTGRPAALLAVRHRAGRRRPSRDPPPPLRRRPRSPTSWVGSTRGTTAGPAQSSAATDVWSRSPEADVVAAKVVAPEVSAEDMQAVAERGWPPHETAPLGEWTLRCVRRRHRPRQLGARRGSPGRAARRRARRASSGWYAERGGPALDAGARAVGVRRRPRGRRAGRSARRTVLRTAPTQRAADAADRPPPRTSASVRIGPSPRRSCSRSSSPTSIPSRSRASSPGRRERVFVEVARPARAGCSAPGGRARPRRLPAAGQGSRASPRCPRRDAAASRTAVMAELARVVAASTTARAPTSRSLAANEPAGRALRGPRHAGAPRLRLPLAVAGRGVAVLSRSGAVRTRRSG